LVNFGMAAVLDRRDGFVPLTAVGTFVGTAEYLAPEQIWGEPTDGRVDVYGLGVTLYFLLTGKFPHSAKNNAALLGRKVREAPLDPRQVAPERQIPAPVAHVVLQALERSREKRFTNALAFAEALDRALPSLAPSCHGSAQ